MNGVGRGFPVLCPPHITYYGQVKERFPPGLMARQAWGVHKAYILSLPMEAEASLKTKFLIPLRFLFNSFYFLLMVLNGVLV